MGSVGWREIWSVGVLCVCGHVQCDSVGGGVWQRQTRLIFYLFPPLTYTHTLTHWNILGYSTFSVHFGPVCVSSQSHWHCVKLEGASKGSGQSKQRPYPPHCAAEHALAAVTARLAAGPISALTNVPTDVRAVQLPPVHVPFPWHSQVSAQSRKPPPHMNTPSIPCFIAARR